MAVEALGVIYLSLITIISYVSCPKSVVITTARASVLSLFLCTIFNRSQVRSQPGSSRKPSSRTLPGGMTRSCTAPGYGARGFDVIRGLLVVLLYSTRLHPPRTPLHLEILLFISLTML